MGLNTIRPIQTRYNGYRFRSRLEARWAVFLDALGIPYEYEPEGYEFPDGTRYLPDFYLPNEDVFLEIKGPKPTPEDKHKAGLLASATGKFVNILIGQPGQHELWAVRPHRPLVHDPAVIDWLASAPVDQAVRIHLASHLISYGQYDIPFDLSCEPPPKRWTVEGNPQDYGNLRLFLDFDEDKRKLAVWRVRFMGRLAPLVDERYGVTSVEDMDFEITCEARVMNAGWGEVGARLAEYGAYAQNVTLGAEYLRAIDRAKSARFEHGESP